MTIHQALANVMVEVQSVRKTDRNEAQNFNFRGIDSVVNALAPALRKFGVIVYPEVLSFEYDTIHIGRDNRPMGHVKLLVRYTFQTLDGSSISTVVAGESMDAGDKGTAKAMSVAFRTALLQTFALPTDEPDPDSYTYERGDAEPETKPKPTMKKLERTKGIPPSQTNGTIASALIVKMGTCNTLDELAQIAGEIVMFKDSGEISEADVTWLRREFTKHAKAIEARG